MTRTIIIEVEGGIVQRVTHDGSLPSDPYDGEAGDQYVVIDRDGDAEEVEWVGIAQLIESADQSEIDLIKEAWEQNAFEEATID